MIEDNIRIFSIPHLCVLSYSSNYPSTVYVYTDADEKDSYLLPTVTALAASKEARFIFILTGDCGSRRKRRKRAVCEYYVT